MSAPRFRTVAVIGTGVIGRSWAVVFGRAGCQTRLFDRDPAQRDRAWTWLQHDIDRDVDDGFVSPADAERLRASVVMCRDIDEALAGAQYVQENTPEILEGKRQVFADLGARSDPGVILASSTSAMSIDEFARDGPAAERSIVAHPVNPPHVVPVVEVLAGEATRPDVTDAVVAFQREIGQVPVKLNVFVRGFLLNRMQAALIREAIHLLEHGVAEPEAIDAVISEGLGLRWALMGPFGVANTNHDRGVRGYFTTFGDAYRQAWDDLGASPTMTPDLIEQMGRGTDAMTGEVPLAEMRRWRDRMIRKLRALKRADPHPTLATAPPRTTGSQR